MLQLDLGCGRRQRDEFVGIDIANFGWNVVCDLTKERLKYEDNSVDLIEANNFFEHLTALDRIKVLNECWRVLKKEGSLQFNVPNASRSIEVAVSDPTHQSLWCYGTFKYLTGEKPRNSDYGIKHWEVLDLHDDPKDDRVIFARLAPKK